MSEHFEGKTVVISGAAAGIGRATALRFSELGVNVAIADIDEDAQGVANEINDKGGNAIFIKTDVTDEDSVKSFIDQVIEEFGSIEFAFNNAGALNEPAKFKDIEVSEFDKVMNVDAKGVFLMMKYELEHMVDNGFGSIVNTASVAGQIADPDMAPYVAGKHAVIGLTKAGGLDHAIDGVRVNAVAPGLTETAMTQSWKEDPEKWEEVTANVPMKKAAQPEEIAGMVVFLCSEDASFANMQTFTVDGGQTAH